MLKLTKNRAFLRPLRRRKHRHPASQRQPVTAERRTNAPAGTSFARSSLLQNLPRSARQRSIRQTAEAEIPSIRPVNPSRSVVVALMDTQSASHPITSAMHSRMASM